ncbi:RHS repeat domain-containing protein [Iodobacter violaceini]|uniref:RHS repeat domain-containing protein n=1 Tax=Iodobacter violaceini TaxID=3044271 RepID=UPI00197B4022|nr:RHS repeat-associated core domain-containing protein [Iodobacter violacea]
MQEIIWLGDTPVAVLSTAGASTNISYIWADHLGTPRQITDPASKQTLWRWDGEPFGNSLADEDPSKTGKKFSYNLRFPGQYFDKETGKLYNYFRDYDPATGRYIESDPIGLAGGINTYLWICGRRSAELHRSVRLSAEFYGSTSGRKNTQQLVQKACNNVFNKDELEGLTEKVINDISLSDAVKFKDIDPNSTPVVLTSEQKKILDGVMKGLQGDALGDKANKQYQKAMQNGVIKVR